MYGSVGEKGTERLPFSNSANKFAPVDLFRHCGTRLDIESHCRQPTSEERQFLVQVTSVLMTSPCDLNLMVAQGIVAGMMRGMGFPSLNVRVGMFTSFIHLYPENGEALVVHPTSTKPTMRALSSFLCQVNNFLDIECPEKSDLMQLSAHMKQCLEAPPTFPKWAHMFGVGMLSAGLCPFFKGGWTEVIWAFFGSISLSLLDYYPRFARYDSVYHVALGCGSTLLPVLVGAYVQKINVVTTALSILMWWLPGTEICAGVTHIMVGFQEAGTAQLQHALAVCFMIAFGMVLGFALTDISLGLGSRNVNLHPTSTVPTWCQGLFLFIATAGAIIVKQANPAHFGQIFAAICAGYFGTSLTEPWLGAFAPLAGGFSLGTVSCFFNLATGLPRFPLLSIGTLPIVPGSSALRSIFDEMAPGVDDTLTTSVGFLGRMFMISFCIYLGTAFSNFCFDWIRNETSVVRPVREVVARFVDLS